MTMENQDDSQKDSCDDREKIAILCNVDVTLLSQADTDLAEERQQLVESLHNKLQGAFALVTSRTSDSIDKVFSFKPPVSVEHHAAMRAAQNEKFQPMANPINTETIAKSARKELKDHAVLVDDKSDLDDTDEDLNVHIEAKEFSLALHFNAAATSAHKSLLKGVAYKLLGEYELTDTYRILQSDNTLELVPNGHSKAQAVQDFMKTPAFKGKVPVFIGRSGSDAAAMKTCMSKFNGFGIAVGDTIPDAPFVAARVQDAEDVWHLLKGLDNDLSILPSPVGKAGLIKKPGAP
ncbi:MAG: HAD-IIB family hydrolase [Alphaproteobacteria bacterium]|nr:HAD-IIB family hydrolase [Alphaproteobacteria bacterium]